MQRRTSLSGLAKKHYLFILFLSFLLSKVNAQTKFDIYYVSIGSVYYKNNPVLTTRAWDNVEEAETSARIMANIFSKCGNAKGITWISKKDQLFSKAELQRSFNQVWQLMLQDKPANPLLVFYFCGHGFSENLVNSQFLLSGDCSTMRAKETFEAFSKKNIFVPEIVEMIMNLSTKNSAQLNVPRYLLLLDCCRKSKQNDSLDSKQVAQKWGQRSKEIELIFSQASRYAVSAFKKAERYADPIVYAATETKNAILKPIPPIEININKPDAISDIGPLCRRTLLLLNKITANNEFEIDLEKFVTDVQDEDLDLDPDMSVRTAVPTSPYTTGRENNGLFLSVQSTRASRQLQSFTTDELLGRWQGIHYYGPPKGWKPEKSYGGVQSLPPIVDTSYAQLSIERISGGRCYGLSYEYFLPDSANNHNIVAFEGSISNGKLELDVFHPISQLLRKYPGSYWCNGSIGGGGVFRKTTEAFTLSGISGNGRCQGGPFKLSKERLHTKKTTPKADSTALLSNNYQKRKIKIVQTLSVESNQVQLKFYDNGEIDGDSISVFINGNLYLAHQRLTDKPLVFTLNLDELGGTVLVSMFAENLGEIPPNTAVMEITDGTKKTEVRLSSTLDISSTVKLKKR